ncbi:MAG TPA: PAC2 family protein [Thermoplasmata archaeon]|nr:PAC2 family protein [Thermoplasmata archaeon]
MEFVWREEGPSSVGPSPGSVMITAFPSAGLASIVAGHYMVRSLTLPRVGRFESPDLSPIAVIQGGIVHPAVRVYGRGNVGLVISEFPPSPAQANAIAKTILDNAERRKVRLIVGLEGVVPHPITEEEESEGGGAEGSAEPTAEARTDAAPEQVWVAYSRRDAGVLKAFEPTRARALEDGVIGGVSGSLLVQGIGRTIPVAVLLVSTRLAEGLPDHRAAAALIETLDRLLPEIKIDTGPLRAQAEEIEKALRAALKAHRQAHPETPTTPVGEMYR